jgi:hypothetical protein
MPRTTPLQRLPDAEDLGLPSYHSGSLGSPRKWGAPLTPSRAEIEKAIALAPLRERIVIRSRFGFDGPSVSRWVVAQALNMPADEVARIESEALRRLRAVLTQGTWPR